MTEKVNPVGSGAPSKTKRRRFLLSGFDFDSSGGAGGDSSSASDVSSLGTTLSSRGPGRHLLVTPEGFSPDLEIREIDEFNRKYPNAKYLINWVPKLFRKRLVVEGDILNWGGETANKYRWSSTFIKSRVSDSIIFTKGGPYILEGKISYVHSTRLNTPRFVITSFMNGFPENWEVYLKQWIEFEEERAANESALMDFTSNEVSRFETTTTMNSNSSVNSFEKKFEEFIFRKPTTLPPRIKKPSQSKTEDNKRKKSERSHLKVNNLNEEEEEEEPEKSAKGSNAESQAEPVKRTSKKSAKTTENSNEQGMGTEDSLPMRKSTRVRRPSYKYHDAVTSPNGESEEDTTPRQKHRKSKTEVTNSSSKRKAAKLPNNNVSATEVTTRKSQRIANKVSMSSKDSQKSYDKNKGSLSEKKYKCQTEAAKGLQGQRKVGRLRKKDGPSQKRQEETLQPPGEPTRSSLEQQTLIATAISKTIIKELPLKEPASAKKKEGTPTVEDPNSNKALKSILKNPCEEPPPKSSVRQPGGEANDEELLKPPLNSDRRGETDNTKVILQKNRKNNRGKKRVATISKITMPPPSEKTEPSKERISESIKNLKKLAIGLQRCDSFLVENSSIPSKKGWNKKVIGKNPFLANKKKTEKTMTTRKKKKKKEAIDDYGVLKSYVTEPKTLQSNTKLLANYNAVPHEDDVFDSPRITSTEDINAENIGFMDLFESDSDLDVSIHTPRNPVKFSRKRTPSRTPSLRLEDEDENEAVKLSGFKEFAFLNRKVKKAKKVNLLMNSKSPAPVSFLKTDVGRRREVQSEAKARQIVKPIAKLLEERQDEISNSNSEEDEEN